MKILTFGEILLRLAAPGYERLFQNGYLNTSFCGGEANVAVSLALLGLQSSFITKVPQNDIGRAAINSLRYFGVDTSNVLWGEGRLGTYYLEKGASQRSSKVIYDRMYSTFALLKENEIDWDSSFDNVCWFHWTGINPALSQGVSDICLKACKKARAKNIIVSCDLNYRGKLWMPDVAQSVMPSLMQYVDICIGNEEDAEKALGIKIDGNDVEKGIVNTKKYIEVASEICNLYGCKKVAFTFRESISASRNMWSAMLYDDLSRETYYSQKYDIQIVDRVGGGDSFSAGLIYAFSKNYGNQEAIEFAVAASCLKHTIEGDFNRVSAEEIWDLVKNGGKGRVQR